jgi:hypothetical protein
MMARGKTEQLPLTLMPYICIPYIHDWRKIPAHTPGSQSCGKFHVLDPGKEKAYSMQKIYSIVCAHLLKGFLIHPNIH